MGEIICPCLRSLTLKHFIFISFLIPDQKLWWQKTPNPRQHGARATSFLKSSSLWWTGAPRSSTSAPWASVNPRQQGLLLHLSSPLASLVPFPPPLYCPTMEEVGAFGDMPEVERCYSFSGQRPTRHQAVSRELMTDVVGCDKSLAGLLTPVSNMVTTC